MDPEERNKVIDEKLTGSDRRPGQAAIRVTLIIQFFKLKAW